MLKCAWCVTQLEWHLPECKRTIRARECCLILVFRDYGNLIVPGIPIQEAVVFMLASLSTSDPETVVESGLFESPYSVFGS